MTVVISNDQYQTKTYISHYEMMQDIAAMANGGYIIVYVLPISYKVGYKKAL